MAPETFSLPNPGYLSSGSNRPLFARWRLFSQSWIGRKFCRWIVGVFGRAGTVFFRGVGALGVLAWWGRRWRCCRSCRSFCWFRMDGLLRCLSRWSHSHHHRLNRLQRPFPFPPKTCPSLYLTHWLGIHSTRWWRRSVMVGMSSLDRHPALCPFECAPLTQ